MPRAEIRTRRRSSLAPILAAVALALTGLPPAAAPLAAAPLRLPLDDYPIDDACGPWGFLNENFPRCGMPGKHVADDACAPFGTPVYAIADGVIMHAMQVGNCSNNWGWLTVAEHTRDDGSKFCAIYGHCRPLAGVVPGLTVSQGQQIATVDWPCGSHHIHFGIAIGAYGVDPGHYPTWLLGYLPDATTCTGYPLPFPGRYVEPVQFVLDSVPVEPASWGGIKARVE